MQRSPLPSNLYSGGKDLAKHCSSTAGNGSYQKCININNNGGCGISNKSRWDLRDEEGLCDKFIKSTVQTPGISIIWSPCFPYIFRKAHLDCKFEWRLINVNFLLSRSMQESQMSGLMTPRTPCDFQTTVYENIPELRPPPPTPPRKPWLLMDF